MKRNRRTLVWFILIFTCTIISAQTILLQEDFSTANGTIPPIGWTVETVAGDAIIDVWRFDNPGRRLPGTPIIEPFACFDSDKLSDNDLAEEVYLVSPVFNAITTDNIILEFDQYFLEGYNGATTVQVFNGTSWVDIYNNSANTVNPHHSTIDITTQIQNTSSAQLRFKWNGNYSWFWIVDNVRLFTESQIDLFTEQLSIVFPRYNVCNDLSWGDYDNDNDLDLIFVGYKDTCEIYENTGDNSFTRKNGFQLTGGEGFSVNWSDFNNDNYLDFIVCGGGNSSSGGPITKIFRNNKDNSFTELSNISIPAFGFYPEAIWGDYNNDGYSDILMVGDGVSKIYRNNADNTFSAQEDIVLSSGSGMSGAAWGDYDNDGDLDIMLAVGDSKIYRNNGNNTFSEQSNISFPGVVMSDVEWGDYDNDGDIDILLTGRNSNNDIAKVYRNNGNNTFTEQTTIDLFGVSFSYASWGDYDNDGYLDLILTGETNKKAYTKLYHNNRDNTFTEESEIDFAGQIGSAEWGDYDNDSDLDIVFPGRFYSGAGQRKIYKNNISKKNTQPIAPQNISAYLDEQKLVLSWDKGTDAETPQLGLTYNLRIGSTPGGCDILSPMALANGKRTVATFGNVWHNTQWIIDLSNYAPLPENIYFSVQTIDNGFLASEWSAENSEISNFVVDFMPISACQNTEIQFEDLSYSVTYPICNYVWKFIEGTSITESTLQNPTYLFNTEGTHHVELTVTNSNGESLSMSKSIIIKPSPIADFAAPAVCQGVPVIFDNTTDLNTTFVESWLWSFDDSTPDSFEEEPGNHGFLNAGNYSVSLKATASNGCQGLIQKVVTVIPPPIAVISTNASTALCDGDSITLSVISNPGFSYTWMIGDVPINNANSNKYIAKREGYYTVEVVNGVASCSNISDPVAVTMETPPATPVIFSENYNSDSCNVSSPITLSIEQTENGITYQWKRNGIIINKANQSNIEGYLSQGEYTVEAHNNVCKSESGAFTISFDDAPEQPIVFVEGPNVWYLACDNFSDVHYQWFYNGSEIHGANTSIYVADQDLGDYFVSVTNSEGCTTSSDIVSVPPNATNIQELEPFDGLNIYPNPTPGKFILEMDNPIIGELVIAIFGETGRRVLNIKFQKEQNYFKTQIDLNGLSSGIYLVVLSVEEYRAERKLIIE